MKKLSIKVNGRVQGVGFRYMTKIVADKLDVKGGVWNCDDGSVAIEAIANDKNMAEFLEEIKKSPSPWGKVTEFSAVINPDIKEINKFEVRN